MIVGVGVLFNRANQQSRSARRARQRRRANRSSSLETAPASVRSSSAICFTRDSDESLVGTATLTDPHGRRMNQETRRRRPVFRTERHLDRVRTQGATIHEEPPRWARTGMPLPDFVPVEASMPESSPVLSRAIRIANPPALNRSGLRDRRSIVRALVFGSLFARCTPILHCCAPSNRSRLPSGAKSCSRSARMLPRSARTKAATKGRSQTDPVGT